MSIDVEVREVEALRRREGFIVDMVDSYDQNFAVWDFIAAINGRLEIEEMKSLFEGKPSIHELQTRLLDEYERTKNPLYLHSFNEYAIRANRRNQGTEVLPINKETYSRFTRLRDNCPWFPMGVQRFERLVESL